VSAQAEEQWKKFLLTLPDAVFFGLMRNYLGGIQTPFNKHDLIKRLTAFLRKEKIRERIIALIDDVDRTILSAVGFLDAVSPEALYNIVRGNMSFGKLMHGISSLEERLLLYREIGEKSVLLKLNPLLAPLLTDNAVGFEYLFRCRSCSVPGVEMWLDENYLAALLAFIHEFPKAVDPEGAIRKKDEVIFTTAFPGFPLRRGKSDETAAAVRSLTALGILSETGNELIFNPDCFEELLSLPSSDRRIMIYSHAVCPHVDEIPDDESMFRVFLQIISSFPRDRAIHETDVPGYIAACSLYERVHIDTGPVLEGLLLLKVFLRDTNGYIALNPEQTVWIDGAGGGQSTPGGQSTAVFQPNFDFLLPAGSQKADLSRVPVLFRLKKYGRMAEYALNQESFIAYLELGGTTGTAKTAIENLTGSPLPDNALMSLKLWEEKYLSIRIYEGTVLRVSDEMEPYLRHSPAFANIIQEELGGGIYYLGTVGKTELRDILVKTGITHPLHSVGSEVSTYIPATGPKLLHQQFRRLSENLFSATTPPKTAEKGDSGFLKALKRSLHEQNMPELLKKEFENRIDRKLILYPGQFSLDVDPQRGKEARGIDYSAKVRLIEEALASGNTLLEIPAEPGSAEMLVVKPVSLHRNGGDSVLTGLILPEEIRKNLTVRKISRIRLLSGYLIPSSL